MAGKLEVRRAQRVILWLFTSEICALADQSDLVTLSQGAVEGIISWLFYFPLTCHGKVHITTADLNESYLLVGASLCASEIRKLLLHLECVNVLGNVMLMKRLCNEIRPWIARMLNMYLECRYSPVKDLERFIRSDEFGSRPSPWGARRFERGA